MLRRASAGIVFAALFTAWLGPVRSTFAQLDCGNWACFEDETSTRLVLTSDTAAYPGTPDQLDDDSNDEMDMDCADVDNDGDDDCVLVYKQLATTTGKRRNWLFLNEGGVMVDRTTEYGSASNVGGDLGLMTQTNNRDVLLVDLTGDGWRDIVTATTLSGGPGGTAGTKHISHPRIYVNLGEDGGGNWLGFVYDDPNRVPTMPSEPRFCAVSAGDIDDDGDNDLYFGDYQQPTSSPRPVDLNDRLWINDGTGYFADESTSRMTGQMLESSFGMATAIADMNGDGRLDIVKDDALNAPQAISISYNNLLGAATDGVFNGYQLAYEFTPYHVSTPDLNGDGKLDIIASDDGQSYYKLNNGNLANGMVSWLPSQSGRYVMGGSPNQFDSDNGCADFNNDGFVDCWVTNVDVDDPSCNQRGHIFHNSGNAVPGGFISLNFEGNLGISLSAYTGSHDGRAIDINGDGWLDWFTGSCTGTFIYINQPPFGIDVSYPNGRPSLIAPDTATTFDVEISSFGGTPDTYNLRLSVDGGPFDTLPLTSLGGDLYQGELPASACMVSLDYYIEVEFPGGSMFRDPATAPGDPYNAISALSQLTYQETVEGDASEWTVANDPGLTAGAWEPADPIGTIFGANVVSPYEAAQGSMAFVTENCLVEGCAVSAADIDGGGTDLISQTFDLSGSDADLSYYLWFYSSSAGQDDTLTVWISNDADQPAPSWVLVSSTTDTGGQWQLSSFRVSEYVQPTSQVAVRFRAVDGSPISNVEGGMDHFRVDQLVCEICNANHCCDLDGNSIRDDACTWCECDGTPCNGLLQQIPIVFADMGGLNGDCLPDGTADANDRFHALNCFADKDINGASGYPCEAAPPIAFNVDAGGPFGGCAPDGVCDANDAFHALNAFSGATACSCPGGPSPSFGPPQVVAHASITLLGEGRVAPGGLVHVDAILDSAIGDLRGYQLHVGVSGGRQGTLELVDILVENRKDVALGVLGPWRAFNVHTGQMAAGLDGQGVEAAAGSYLATFVFRATPNAEGTFLVDLRHDQANPTDRTFLFASETATVALDASQPAIIHAGAAKPHAPPAARPG